MHVVRAVRTAGLIVGLIGFGAVGIGALLLFPAAAIVLFGFFFLFTESFVHQQFGCCVPALCWGVEYHPANPREPTGLLRDRASVCLPLRSSPQLQLLRRAERLEPPR